MPTCSGCGQAAPAGARFCPFDGTALGDAERPRDPILGITIGDRYRVSHRLGAGGQSIVYLARHTALDRDVAIKVLQRGPSFADRVARFAREARACSRIDHENVVYVLDFGYAEEQSFYYLVMEHVAGTPLDVELQRVGRMPAARAVHIVSQIASGMGRAHELGIVHRDLKPDNVVLCHQRGDPDFVKIVDFGISKPWLPDPSMPPVTLAGELFGTPDYMAPEQWSGEPCDPRTDIYALGVLAYELLTGKAPFEGGVGVLMKQHLLDAPAPLRSRVPQANIPALLEQAVMRCLEKSPAARHASSAELLKALEPVWTELRSSVRRTTYAPASSLRRGAIPDPTVYVSSDLDVVWDGPTICDELARLHDLRRKRLNELASALWTEDAEPAELREQLAPIVELEARLERTGQELALLEARVAESERAASELEAATRLQIIDAHLEVSVFDDLLPSVVSVGLGSDALELTEPGADDELAMTLEREASAGSHDPGTRERLERALRDAEHRLVQIGRRRRREAAELEAQLVTRVGAIRQLEAELGPRYQALSKLVQLHAAKRPALRSLVVAFAQIDGAIAAYQALLDMMDTDA